ncbi:MAG: ribose 5-phosphate isomerase B [Bacilli bacterium]|jgi:ribose 5-phosphate isomerase B|nr:ribose 5-phosphate isomerase B [Bacilli bacterium]MDD4056537.1 ribose 5-phosphate isomerase B [Bacilli bacterium]MDY0208859.1 ribose 5-phosphate isomerase B [Bacilli bacterium]
MTISIGSDHGGYQLKEQLMETLKEKGYKVIDQGCLGLESVDYPFYARRVARDIQNDISTKGILICTTGIGMSITANKFKGIRAALVTNEDAAKLSRQHNDSNIICLGAKYTPYEEAIKYVLIFLGESFLGERHSRRVNMIKEVEEK